MRKEISENYDLENSYEEDITVKEAENQMDHVMKIRNILKIKEINPST